MEKGNIFEKEEIKALIIFLSLFFVIFFAYDFAEKAMVLLADKNQKLADAFGEGLGLWLYSLMVGLFFIGLYFMKWKKPYIVKYIILIGYNILDFINNFIIYYGSDAEFDGGNIVEGFFILFAPIFVNKRYFWLVAGTIVGKYAYGIRCSILYCSYPNSII